MSGDGGYLHIIDGTLNVRKYIDTILELHQGSFSEQCFIYFSAEFYSLPHSKIIQRVVYYKEQLSWAGNSSDFNPIENLWHHLKTLFRMRHPSNKMELIDSTIVSWHHVITKEDIKPLISSIKH